MGDSGEAGESVLAGACAVSVGDDVGVAPWAHGVPDSLRPSEV